MNAAALAALLSLALAASRQDADAAREAPAAEGPLDNDVFVPIAEAAAQAFASGDREIARSRAAKLPNGAAAPNPAEAARLLDAAFEHWREALLAGGPGATTWIEENAGGEQRLAEGVHAGLVRRLASLGDEERARWSARLAAEAAGELASIGASAPAQRTGRLTELVRTFPATSSAARAALALGDLALEAGLTRRARAWYERGAREADLAGERAVTDALRARRAALPSAGPAAVEPWERARHCEFVDAMSWNETGRAKPPVPPDERWLRPGGAFTGDASFVVQTPGELLFFSLAHAPELALAARLRTADYLGSAPPDLPFEAPREPPGWPLLPLADELGVVAVVGRARAGEPNALLALALEAPSAVQELGLEIGRPERKATRAWAIVGPERLDAEDEPVPVPELDELGDFEFQPGPIASGDLVVVQARAAEGQVRAWLLAFDRRDGALAWKRMLAAGADRVPARRFAPVTRHVASQPLLALEPDARSSAARVFAGTHLGLGVLVDSLLGEPVWCFKNRRRDEHERGWSGDRPLAVAAEGGPLLLWGPMDSDRLYSLAPVAITAPRPDDRVVLTRPPAPLADAEALLGGGAESQLVLASRGGERTVTEARGGADRIDSLALPRDERFSGLGLASPERAWVASIRALYLLDRTRELYLLARTELPPAGGEAPGGDLYARGVNVLVVGSSTLWWFRAR